MIYICYGVTKSASTFLYQLTEETFRSGGRRVAHLGPPFRPRLSVDNYIERIDLDFLARLKTELRPDEDVVLKTHGLLYPEMRDLVQAGAVLANASIRDPREIALSMVDHGVRSRHVRQKAFSEHHDVRDTLATLDDQFERFRVWSSASRVQVFTFNQICFSTAEVVDRLAKQIGVEVDASAVATKFGDRTRIGQFSKGVAFRYREMSPDDDRLFLERYADLYASIAFETPEAKSAATQQRGVVKPRSEIAQILTFLRRYFRP
jgi:hypothetical protein